MIDILNRKKNQGNEVFFDDGVIPTTGETVSTNAMQGLQTSKAVVYKNLTYAVVGASNDENKYGHKVFRDLLENGYHVIAINPHEEEILGQKVFPTLTSYGEKIDIVIFVVPPKVTETILEEVAQLKISQVRMQPGSESKNAISFCDNNNIACTHDACIMIQRQQIQEQSNSQ